MPAACSLDVYGLRIEIAGDWPEVIDDLRLDFAWFTAPERAAPDVTVTLERRPPDFGAFDGLAATFVTPRNVVYRDGDRAVIDYFGEALSVYERARGELRVQGEHRALVHQAAYLFLLSRAGEHFERIGRPRLHALGLVGRQGAVAVMLPSGGGKSTLALRALEADGVKLLSEDSPLIDRHGTLHPFPLRIGVNPTDAARLPAHQVRTIERLEFHPKAVLELDAFADRIEADAQPLRHLVVGRRTLARTATLEPLPRRALAGTLLRECVVGVGLYQGMEFILQEGMRDLPRKLRPVSTRALCAAAALARARTWQLDLGRDREANWETLRPLLD